MRVPHQSIYCGLPTYRLCFHFMCFRNCTSPISVCLPASGSATATLKKIQQFPPHPNTGTESSRSPFILMSPKDSFLFQDQNIHFMYTAKFSIGLLCPLELGWATYLHTDSGAYFVFPFLGCEIPKAGIFVVFASHRVL